MVDTGGLKHPWLLLGAVKSSELMESLVQGGIAQHFHSAGSWGLP